MKAEKVLLCIAAVLIILCGIVYFTLPEQGEQIYIPSSVQPTPEGFEIPEGYKLVDNFSDVYYVETDEGITYYWLVQFSDGIYGWQEVDKDGNIVFPNREPEPEVTEPRESTLIETETETTTPEETEPAETETDPSETEATPSESNEELTAPEVSE